MSKKLHTQSIANDLEGSAFFPARKPLPSPSLKEDTSTPEARPITHTSDEGVPPPLPLPVPRGVPPAVPLIRKVKRAIRQRQPFDIYEDQYETLKHIADSERDFVNGRGMSHMVREAIDHYLRDHRSQKK
jgi:hypothetical protein